MRSTLLSLKLFFGKVRKLTLTSILPIINFFTHSVSTLAFYATYNYGFSWKVSNYADAYWFIYSNKNVLLGKRYLY